MKKFEHIILAYGKSMNILITPDEGEIFGLTENRQTLIIELQISKNSILIKKKEK